ncbi:MAG: heme-copper oxidase subunit III [Pyrinomonadaceae bacterium]
MEIGTLEPLAETESGKSRRRSSLTGSGGGPKNGGRGGNGGDGGDGPRSDDDSRLDRDLSNNKPRIVTVFLLLVVTMTFGGLAAAYVVISTNRAIEWRPFELPIPVWISTILILASSLTYQFANAHIQREDQPAARRWLVATSVLGAAFIASQMLAWIELQGRGFYFSGNPYAGFFYVLTGIHALHVIGGIVALGAVLLRAWDPRVAESDWPRLQTLGQTVGWYWHFMDAVWIVLFVLLGFWK